MPTLVEAQAKDIVLQSLTDLAKNIAVTNDGDLRTAMISQLTHFVYQLREHYHFPPFDVSTLSSESELHSDVTSETTSPPESSASTEDSVIPPGDVISNTSRRRVEPSKSVRTSRKRSRSDAQRDRVSSTKEPDDDDEEGAEGRRKRSRHGRTSAARADDGVLVPDTKIALTPDDTIGDLDSGRLAFYDEVTRLSVDVIKDNQHETVGFTTNDANEVTSLLVDEVAGIQSLKRLTHFVELYNRARKDEPDIGAAARAESLASEKEIPQTLRRFYGTFSHQQRTRANTPAMVQHVEQILQSIKLLQQYETVKKLAENKDSELIKYFRTRGMSASKGRNWVSITIDHLAEQLDVKRTVLVESCQKARGLQDLINVFGEGILLVLPPNAMSRLRKLGHQRMKPVYPALKRHIPQLQNVCDLLRSRFYVPFITGSQRLPSIGEIGTGDSTRPDTYLEMLQERSDIDMDLD